MIQQLFNILEQHMILDEDRKNLIRSKFQVEKLNKGEVFIETGKVSKKAGFVLSGILRFYYVDKFGKEITTMFIKENELVARIKSFFDLFPSNRTVVAEVNSTVLTISHENYISLIAVFPELHVVLSDLTTNFLTKTSKHQRSYIDHLGVDRYELFLSHFPKINKKISLGHVASYIGISPPTLSRIRKRMKSQ